MTETKDNNLLFFFVISLFLLLLAHLLCARVSCFLERSLMRKGCPQRYSFTEEIKNER